jgi:hypothetical protein
MAGLENALKLLMLCRTDPADTAFFEGNGFDIQDFTSVTFALAAPGLNGKYPPKVTGGFTTRPST